MLILQLPPRQIKFERPPSFPAPIQLHVDLEPRSVFGEEPIDNSRLRMGPAGTKVQLHADVYRGGAQATLSGQFDRLELTSMLLTYPLRISGARASFTIEEGTLDDLIRVRFIAEIQLPAILSALVHAPITSSAVSGTVGGSPFVVEFAGTLEMQLFVDSSERIAERTQEYLKKISALPVGSDRIFAAHRYLQQARRLRMVSEHPGEFLGERILNLYKMVEALFSTRKVLSLRPMLRALGVERDVGELICSIVYVRDQLDSGHMALHALAAAEYELVHRFADRAENVAAWLLMYVVDACAAGTFKVKAPQVSDRVRLLAALEQGDAISVDPYDPTPIKRSNKSSAKPQ